METPKTLALTQNEKSDPNGGDLAIHHSVSLTQEQVKLLKRTVCKGSTDDELAMFLHVAQRAGLDPFARQIHAVKRWDARENRESMVIQTGIDGYRVIAQRTGQYAGNDEAKYVSDENGNPLHATVTVYRLIGGVRCPFSATARWHEYKQTKKDGTLFFMWSKMPYLMLGKCAEALALRKAFPAELSGFYTHEEMDQADSEPIVVVDLPERSSNSVPMLPKAKNETADGFAPKTPVSKTAVHATLAGLTAGEVVELKGHACEGCGCESFKVAKGSARSKNPGRLYFHCADPKCKNEKGFFTFAGFCDEVIADYGLKKEDEE